jgi:hypothetical protein
MATPKKSHKTAKALRKGRKLEAQKPLTKLSVPTEAISLPYGHIEVEYKP